jgi:hypothetical protein
MSLISNKTMVDEDGWMVRINSMSAILRKTRQTAHG